MEMEKERLDEKIKIIKNEYSSIAPKAAERLQKLPFLLLTNLPLTADICLTEATTTYGFGTFLASITVCRVCLEAVLVAEYGKKERDLKTLINKCKKKGILSSSIAKKAHQLREIGNNYVHMLTNKIAEELVRAGKVRRFQRTNEDVILVELGKESDALKANILLRDILKFLYGSQP